MTDTHNPNRIVQIITRAGDRVRDLLSPLCDCDEPYQDPDDPEPFCWRCRRPLARDEDEA